MASETVKQNVQGIINLVKSYDPNADTDMIQRAFELADKAHAGQKRKSGEDYIIHPVAVAYILAQFKMDVETITAALLHDVIEDTVYTYETIAEEFNENVADLVEGVTKIGKIEFQSQEESQAENLRKMVMAMSRDIRVIIIKLMDRLHNMRTLEYMRPEKQQEKSRETMDIYAPIANRLGIQAVKGELEDLALKYLDPDGYSGLLQQIDHRRHNRNSEIDKLIETIRSHLDNAGIEAKIYGRTKHLYSIYRKMRAQHRKIDEIYDIMAVRVIVNSVRDCYGVLGIVHTLWKPIPGRFKDYIAMPKPNMYQSIHTSVIGPNGDPFEIQIRTKEMHETAEYGIAAHWKYKEGLGESKGKEQRYESKMAWLRQIMEWQRELDNAGDLMETIKADLLNEELYVFSPKGKVVELPMGSCPLDFAYRIHSDVGNTCVGAKINGKIVPLNYKLSNGDIVEVMTSKHSNGPSRDWLKMVKSAHARNKIRQYFKKEEKEENIAKGKLMFENELKRQNLKEGKGIRNGELEILAEKLGSKTVNDLYAEIGYSGIKLGTVFTKLRLLFPDMFQAPNEEVVLKKPTKKRKPLSDVIVAGKTGIEVHYSKCCNPVPGDQIIGYISQNGISIHRSDCPNVDDLSDPSRLVSVEWNRFGVMNRFTAVLNIKAREKTGMLIDISKVFLDLNIALIEINARNEKGKFDYFHTVFEVKSKRELSFLITKLNSIPEIVSVKRA